MGALRDITLTIDEETLHEASALAAEDGLSIAALLRRELMNLVESRRGYARAKESALRRLARGTSLGVGDLTSTREGLHAREELR